MFRNEPTQLVDPRLAQFRWLLSSTRDFITFLIKPEEGRKDGRKLASTKIGETTIGIKTLVSTKLVINHNSCNFSKCHARKCC